MAEAGNPEVAPRRSLLKAFRPLLIWLVVSLVLLAGYYHQKLLSETKLEFQVLVEGQPQMVKHSVTLNGAPFVSGQRASPGKKTLVIDGIGIEPVTKEFKVRYGKNDLGTVNLVRQRGGLEIRVVPAPKEIRISGASPSDVVAGSVAKFPALLVGKYQVEIPFETFKERREVEVRRNETTKLDIKANAGFVLIAAEPADANFRLSSRAGIRLEGKTPGNVFVPAGEYELTVARGNYEKKLTVHVASGVSNDVVAKFEYGEIQFVTTPPGATIRENFTTIGQTPYTLSQVRPGNYQYRLELVDYIPVGVKVAISGNESITISTNLVSRRFVAAMEGARRELARTKPNFQTALARTEEALAATPGNPEALELKSRIASSLAQQRANPSEPGPGTQPARAVSANSGGAQPAVALAKSAEGTSVAGSSKSSKAAATFQQMTGADRDAALFDTYEWSFPGNVAQLRTAVVRTFGDLSARWKLPSESRVNSETILFRAVGVLPPGDDPTHCAVLISQIAPTETVVLAKFSEYTINTKLGLKLLFADAKSKWIPIHADYYETNKVGAAEARRKARADSFKTHLQSQLR